MFDLFNEQLNNRVSKFDKLNLISVFNSHEGPLLIELESDP